MHIDFEMILEFLKVCVVPLLGWAIMYMKEISKSLVSLKQDIGEIKTTLATTAVKHEDLERRVDDIVETQERRATILDNLRDRVSKLERD